MRNIKTSLVFAAGVVALFATSARAQEVISAKVPFAFTVGQREFPAGQYDITIGDLAGMVISIRETGNGVSAFALTNSADGFDPAGYQPALVFIKSETEYQLSQVWESSTGGRALPVLARHKQIGRADTDPATGEVALVIAAERK
jgi:hypothetical protein